jgi:hypothetical protein
LKSLLFAALLLDLLDVGLLDDLRRSRVLDGDVLMATVGLDDVYVAVMRIWIYVGRLRIMHLASPPRLSLMAR